MGRAVLNTTVHVPVATTATLSSFVPPSLRGYAHCARTPGRLVLALANVNNHTDGLNLPLSSITIEGQSPNRDAGGLVVVSATQYVLSRASADSDSASLNGGALSVEYNETDGSVRLPSLAGQPVPAAAKGVVHLPFGAVAFLELQLSAPAPACT
jgi:hypothetical protein